MCGLDSEKSEINKFRTSVIVYRVHQPVTDWFRPHFMPLPEGQLKDTAHFLADPPSNFVLLSIVIYIFIYPAQDIRKLVVEEVGCLGLVF